MTDCCSFALATSITIMLVRIRSSNFIFDGFTWFHQVGFGSILFKTSPSQIDWGWPNGHAWTPLHINFCLNWHLPPYLSKPGRGRKMPAERISWTAGSFGSQLHHVHIRWVKLLTRDTEKYQKNTFPDSEQNYWTFEYFTQIKGRMLIYSWWPIRIALKFQNFKLKAIQPHTCQTTQAG